VKALDIPRVPLRIGGAFVASKGEYFDVTDPSTGEPLAQVPRTTAAEIGQAVAAAAAAFPGWAATPVVERSHRLFPLALLLEKYKEDLARLVSQENGKCLADSRAEVRRGIELVEFACGMPTLLMGDSLEEIARGIDSQTIRQPLGVCAGITPFNFPFMVPLWMYPLAIAAGNTFVLKPSPLTPLAANRAAELFYECDFPTGVLNVVHGEKDAVEALIASPDVAAVSFVGSSKVARHVQRTGVEHRKRVQALGGAKNHLVVMPDAVDEKTLDAVMGSAFGGAGERCLAGSVVVAVGSAGDSLVPLLRGACERLKLGSPLEHDTGMGPVISADAKARIEGYIEEGARSGFDVVCDGRRAASPNAGGTFLGPTIFDRVDPSSKVAREEIFGPVLCVVRAPDLEAAIDVTNASAYGNAASIFTQNGAWARTFASKVRAGMVGINIGVAAPMAFFPFGGVKESLFGDLRIHGKDGVAFYTQQKVTITRW
jgi:malonate-semialdehyde dehydrogenase (acetylating) / methylmalonate-semialdehyde dehydrogenase